MTKTIDDIAALPGAVLAIDKWSQGVFFPDHEIYVEPCSAGRMAHLYKSNGELIRFASISQIYLMVEEKINEIWDGYIRRF